MPAFIYSTKLNDAVVGNGENAHAITKFTTMYDFTVTMLTLLGVNYYPSQYLGYPAICKVIDENGNIIDLGSKAYIPPIAESYLNDVMAVYDFEGGTTPEINRFFLGCICASFSFIYPAFNKALAKV